MTTADLMWLGPVVFIVVLAGTFALAAFLNRHVPPRPEPKTPAEHRAEAEKHLRMGDRAHYIDEATAHYNAAAAHLKMAEAKEAEQGLFRDN